MNRNSSVRWEQIKDYLAISCPGCHAAGKLNVFLQYIGPVSQCLLPCRSIYGAIKELFLGEAHMFRCPSCEAIRTFEEIRCEHRERIAAFLEEFKKIGDDLLKK